LKISYFGYIGLSAANSAQFTFKKHVTARNCETFIKNFYLSRSGSFKVIDVDIPKKLVTSACYDEQHICASLQPFLH